MTTSAHGSSPPPPTGVAAEGAAYTALATSLGTVYVAWTDLGMAALAFGPVNLEGFMHRCQALLGVVPVRDDGRQAELTAVLEAWLEGRPYQGSFDLRSLTPFDRTVLECTLTIPRGEVRPYSWVAEAIGRPRAARAVGNALARNPVPLLIPCHRVVRKDGHLGPYSGGGPEWKARLLRLEGAVPVKSTIPSW